MNEKLKKSALIVSIIAGFVAIIFGILDITNVWGMAHIFASVLFAVSIGLQAVVYWNENRKIAIVELVVAVILFVLAVANIIL